MGRKRNRKQALIYFFKALALWLGAATAPHWQPLVWGRLHRTPNARNGGCWPPPSPTTSQGSSGTGSFLGERTRVA